jgi:two-component system, NtrC family, response regulator GlrR
MSIRHSPHAALEETPLRSVPVLAWTDAAGTHQIELREARTAGSAPGSPLLIADRAVSRIHAELLPLEDGLWVRDLGSRNGTYIAGVKVTEARVPNGAALRMGATEIAVAYGPPEPVLGAWSEATFGPLLGASFAMREVFAQIARAAGKGAPALITGEPGTGKEIVARAVHEASHRADAPFIVLDCAASAENLLEGELFGVTKATGGGTARAGAFEAAHGGTIFLDEIGEMPLALQPKLARVLETGTVRRIGETQPRPVDVRVLSATHRDLRTMVNRGTMREDVYFRLAGHVIVVPPLRDRVADIPLLLEQFVSESGGAVGPDLATEVMRMPWPGNVRELRNFADRMIAVGANRALAMAQPGDAHDMTVDAPPRELPPDLAQEISRAPADEGPVPKRLEPWFETGYKSFRERWMDLGEREYLRRLMLRTNRISSVASRESGLERTYLYRLLKKHGV